MFGNKVKLSADLFERVKKRSEELGYASVEEFVEHALEKAVAGSDRSANNEEVKKKLEGLGYLG